MGCTNKKCQILLTDRHHLSHCHYGSKWVVCSLWVVCSMYVGGHAGGPADKIHCLVLAENMLLY